MSVHREGRDRAGDLAGFDAAVGWGRGSSIGLAVDFFVGLGFGGKMCANGVGAIGGRGVRSSCLVDGARSGNSCALETSGMRVPLDVV